MAVDTENKRRSVQAYTLGMMRPAPDGTIDASDRACSAWFYSGITYALPSAAVGGLFRGMILRFGRMFG